MADFFGAIILGAVCGVLGSLYIYINQKVNYIRKKKLTNKALKIAEACALIFITRLIFYFAPLTSQCEEITYEYSNYTADLKQYTCPADNFNPLATLLFNRQSVVIKAMLNLNLDQFAYTDFLIFFLSWYILTTVTSGTALPLGIFLP